MNLYPRKFKIKDLIDFDLKSKPKMLKIINSHINKLFQPKL